ncbi:MAG: NAD(+) synthase [Oscillospiraceae bacterium]|jgi:NAD+ synthase (glutamine-hydrolysing)|nr:NAD(+) synthase [Oscillospiraceae bacterium]
MNNYTPAKSFIRVASACPDVAVYKPSENTKRIAALYEEASASSASLVVFPELSITGYSIGDLVMQTSLLSNAKSALLELARLTSGKNCALIVGLPYAVGGALYNCGAFLADGEVKGLVPKQNLPSYNEFYENRWYSTTELSGVTTDGFPFGTNLLFEVDGATVGIEICEDAWVASPPSERLALSGANLLVNLSASPEKIGVSRYRRELVKTLSSRLMAGYIYAGCDSSESTAEVVMGGHQIIAANGQILAERPRFTDERLIFADIDLEHLAFDRRKQRFASLGAAVKPIFTKITRNQSDCAAKINKNPFLPEETEAERSERLEELLSIQTEGLYRRLQKTGLGAVLGLSGGLDSTLALLIVVRAVKKLGKPELAHVLVMPGPASSDQTQSNAVKLAEGLGVKYLVRPIETVVNAELALQEHDPNDQNVTYENIQARIRMLHPLNYANENGLLVINTSDLSESALGWSTYGGDQTGNYGVNCSVPKTVIREAIRYLSAKPEYAAVKDVLVDIIDTPISPELTSGGEGITQLTEDKIGPYALHDFYLYHFIRRGDAQEKISYLAKLAFAGEYDAETIDKWLNVFVRRFLANQFKRDTMPNGPKVGAVALSPRGDWRMPSDL